MKFKCDGIVEVLFEPPEDGFPIVIVDFGENSFEIFGEGEVDQRRGKIVANYQIQVRQTLEAGTTRS